MFNLNFKQKLFFIGVSVFVFLISSFHLGSMMIQAATLSDEVLISNEKIRLFNHEDLSDLPYTFSSFTKIGDVFVIVGTCPGKMPATGIESNDACIFRYSAHASGDKPVGTYLSSTSLPNSGNDTFHAIKETADGGFIAVGSFVSSDLEGSFNKKDVNYFGGIEAFIAKFDSAGNQVWLKGLAGSKDEIFYDVAPTSDGGYIAVGETSSNDGQLDNKGKGGKDALIVRFTSNGNLIDGETFGGTSDERFTSILVNSDSYVAVGESTSRDGHITDNQGDQDAIIVKYDSRDLKKMIWKQNFGGSLSDTFASLTKASDGNYLAVGTSASTDKAMTGINKGNKDGILVKFNERTGTVESKKSFGGSMSDQFYRIRSIPSRGYLVTGTTSSENGDLSRVGVRNEDALLVRYDENGELLWKKTFGGSGFEVYTDAYSLGTGEIATIGYTNSNDGDLQGIHSNNKQRAFLNVFQETLLPKSIQINENDFTIPIEQSKKLSVTINPSYVDNRVLRWISSNEQLVSVDNNGVVRAKAIGKATIRVQTENNKFDEVQVTVSEVIPNIFIGGGGGSFFFSPVVTKSLVEVSLNKVVKEGLHTDKENGSTIEAKLVGEKVLDEIGKLPATSPVRLRAETVLPASGMVMMVDAQTLKTLQTKNVIIELSTKNAIYEVPTSRLNIESLADEIGGGIALKDITVTFAVQPSSALTKIQFETAANQKTFTIVKNAMTFTMIASAKNKDVPITEIAPYRYMSKFIPTTLSPSQYATAVRVEADGSIVHVPTKRMTESGQTYIVIQGLEGSGAYGVIANAKNFTDIENHWAKNFILDGGLRTIIDGVGNNRFEPGRSVTRAEFAAMIIRALGLQAKGSSKAFIDVKSSDWFSTYVQSASAYQLISGYEDNSFRPNQSISREEAMVMLARAMRLIDYATQVSNNIGSIDSYLDKQKVSSWAVEDANLNIKAKTIQGDIEQNLRPQAAISRAETATVMIRLLRQASLIDLEL